LFEVITVSLGLIVAVALLLGGIQIAIAVGLGGLLTLLLNEGPSSLNAVGFIVWGSVNSSTLSALPLFILMAELMLRSGVSDSYYDGMTRLIRRIPGGLLQTNIASCSLFAAISGSSVATAAAIGGVAIPRQKADGYDLAMTTGSIAAGGTLGILIPPSIVMIIYATFSELSVAKLFIAGLVPGIVLTLMFMAYIAARCLINPKLAPPMPPAEPGSIWKGVKEVAPMVGLMLVILGSIYLGIATPTEAAAVGAFIAAIIAWFVRRPPLRAYGEALMNTVVISASILFIAIGAFIFNYAVQTTGIATDLAKWVVSLDLNVYVFLIAMFVFYAILGCLVDSIGMIVMTVPLLLPILVAYHVDLIWFGVILVVVVELGQITPPVGINLFVVDSIARVGIGPVIKGVIPYFYIFGIFLAMLLLWPQMATWLPSHM
jgi:tripartite ATP-independent transporter DctM subunit